MLNLYYTKLIAPSIQSLCTEIMVLGLFVVGFSYIREAIVNRQIFRQGYFWRQVLLLASVTIFCVYIIISYNVDALLHQSNVEQGAVISVRLFFVIMPIVDLLLVGITGAMFICLSWDSLVQEEDNDQSSSKELSILLFLSSAWHFVCIFWWLMWVGSSMFDICSIWYHFFVFSIYCSSLIGWRKIIRCGIYTRHKELCEWCSAVWYILIIVVVYCTRMIHYADIAFPELSKS